MSTDFKWDDQLAQEYAEQYRFSSSRITIEQFKESKQPKPEWEILSYISRDSLPEYIIDQKNWNWNHAVIKDYPIYSVKRLSDGEVFTVGDKYRNDVGTKEYTIKAFELKNGELRANATEHGFDYFYNLIKIKKCLFTTEDGIEYYANQRRDIYCIPKYGNTAYKVDVHPEYYAALSDTYSIFFSTKEAAEEYVLWHKPCLSLSEVLTRHSCVGKQGNEFIESMKRLASLNIKK